jgi:hypothetical protein
VRGPNAFPIPEGSMSWLSTLEEYAAGYRNQLRSHGFRRTSSQDGPGMGAGIRYAHKVFEISLVNDRGEFRIDFRMPSQRVNLDLMLAFLEATKNGRDFSELSFKEKIGYWKIESSSEDPFAAFFPALEGIIAMLKNTEPQTLKAWIAAYSKDRGKWLFGDNFF